MYRAAKNAARESNFQDAYKLALKAYSIEPSYKDNLLFLGKMHYNDHNYKESIHFIEEYIKTSGEDTALIHYLHGKALFNNDSISGSKLALKKSLSCDHTFAKSTLLLAKCYLREGAIPKAIKTLQRGIKSSPTNEQIKLSLQKLETIQSGQKI
jgi:tetratricopeptide (TPR) repeat protein